MQRQLQFQILPQPDDTTCGPTCLQAVYRFFGEEISLETVIRETPQLEDGGTLAVLLGCHALRRGYRATIYTYNLSVFDPTWFQIASVDLVERLRTQMTVKSSARLHAASHAYILFLQLGGRIRMKDLTVDLIRQYLNRDIPILAGLSATYLYGCPREIGADNLPDDIRGWAAGHFVVLCGYDRVRKKVLVADPYLSNPFGAQHYYEVGLERLICAIMLGVLTYDANLLILQPGSALQRESPTGDGRGRI